jgi:hypothetical protein
VRSLCLLVSLAAGSWAVPRGVRALRDHGAVRSNYRGVEVAFPAGAAVAAGAATALAPLALARAAGAPVVGAGTARATGYVFGVAALGLVDDLAGSGESAPRGWRGHGRALVEGRPSTGALKGAGAAVLAALALRGTGLGPARFALGVLVLVLATNLFNLLDLRPGRALKALALLGAGLGLATRDAHAAWTLAPFLGPLAAELPLDLREEAMLGDTGANLAGAVAGLWLVLSLRPRRQLAALALLVAATIYGELRSISAWIERTPGIRHLDSLGRTAHA